MSPPLIKYKIYVERITTPSCSFLSLSLFVYAMDERKEKKYFCFVS
jgi:hypothetical protein